MCKFWWGELEQPVYRLAASRVRREDGIPRGLPQLCQEHIPIAEDDPGERGAPRLRTVATGMGRFKSADGIFAVVAAGNLAEFARRMAFCARGPVTR